MCACFVSLKHVFCFSDKYSPWDIVEATLQAAKIPVELLGAKRDQDDIRKASKSWLFHYSEDPMERGIPSGSGRGEGGASGGGDDIADPDLAGFWSNDEEGKAAVEGSGEEEKE